MDLLEQAAKVVKMVGESVVDSVKTVGDTIYTSTKDHREIVNLKIQKSSVQKKLQDSYAVIGKMYVDFLDEKGAEESFDASDFVQSMKDDLDKLAEIEASIEQINLSARKEEEEKIQQRAKEEYQSAKEKLDKALQMDIITQEEYDKKMIPIQNKYDNYVQLRKIDMQLEMNIITKEEYEQKVKEVLEG